MPDASNFTTIAIVVSFDLLVVMPMHARLEARRACEVLNSSEVTQKLATSADVKTTAQDYRKRTFVAPNVLEVS